MRRGILAGLLVAVAVLIGWLLSGSAEPRPGRGLSSFADGPGSDGERAAADPARSIPEQTPARIAVPTDVAARGRGTLRVTVTLGPEAPLPHVAVQATARDGRTEEVTRRTAITGADGTAAFAELEAGSWHVRLDRWPEASVDVKADEVAELAIVVPPGITALARVLDASGNPVPGADVLFWGASSSLDIPSAEPGNVIGSTDANGELPLLGLPHMYGHGCWLAACHTAFGTSPARMVASPTDDSDRATRVIELRLGLTGAFLELRVADASGQPVAGARAEAEPVDKPGSRDDGKGRSLSHLLRSGRTDASGRMRLGPLVPCEYRLEVMAAGCARHGEPFAVTDDRELARSVVLVREARVHGRVAEPGGQPVAGANVRVHVEPSGGWTVTGPDGRFAIGALSSGPATCIAGDDSHEKNTASILLEPGGDVELAITLQPMPSFHGRLVDEAGRALEGWSVLITGELPTHVTEVRRAITDADGHFATAAHAGLEYELTVVEPGRHPPLRLPDVGVVGPREEPWLLRVPDSVRCSAWVEGILVDEAGQPAIAERALSLGGEHFTASPGNNMEPATIDATTGSFRIGPLPPGRYKITFESRKAVSFTVPDVLLVARDTTRLGRIVVPASGMLAIELTVEAGLRIGDVMLQVDSPHGSDWEAIDLATLRTEKRLLPGRYRLTIYGTGFRWLKQDVDVQADATATVRGLLRAAVRVGLRMHMPAGERSATFAFRDARGELVFDTELEPGTASEDQWPLLDRGTFQVEAVGASGRRYATSFKVDSLERRQELIELRLEPVR